MPEHEQTSTSDSLILENKKDEPSGVHPRKVKTWWNMVQQPLSDSVGAMPHVTRFSSPSPSPSTSNFSGGKRKVPNNFLGEGVQVFSQEAKFLLMFSSAFSVSCTNPDSKTHAPLVSKQAVHKGACCLVTYLLIVVKDLLDDGVAIVTRGVALVLIEDEVVSSHDAVQLDELHQPVL